MIKMDEIVSKISHAHKTKQPIEFIRHDYKLDEDTAYFVQEQLVMKQAILHNAEIAGYKVSMTSAETQAIANTNEPAYGTLLSTHIQYSGDTIPLSSLFDPLIEPEIMFILQEDLSPNASEEEIIQKSKVCAGIEIPDARYIDWFPNFSLADLLCDNTATGLVVLADPIEPLTFNQFEHVEMELFHNGEKISEGMSSAVLGNPVSSVAWLSEKLAMKNKVLQEGMVISSGTFISPLVAKEGTYKVTYSHIGEVEITFE
ncbi:2-keto-4-pentenoate hydratase [Sporosarcina sp. 179-K 8C2 HS]